MRRVDLSQFIGDLAPPVERFARESRVRLVLLINASGQVLAQHGFARALDVMGMASLSAGIHASSRAVAGLLGMNGFELLHQGAGQAQIFIGPFQTPSEELILIAVFGDDSSLGLVQVFFQTLVREVRALPGWSVARPSGDAASFEHDLEAGLDHLFGAA